MTDAAGDIVWEATYEAFGKAAVDPESTITNNLRFPGQYFDSETGLHYNWNRYYDPTSGRYISEDPIGLGGGSINLFSYVYANTINLIDNNGKEAKKPVLDLQFSEGVQFGFTAKLMGKKLCKVELNLGREEHNLNGPVTVSQSVEFSVGPVGFQAERRAEGETQPPKFDYLGRVIPGTGKSIPGILKNVPFKVQGPIIKKDNIKSTLSIDDDVSIDYDAAAYWGIKGQINLSEIDRRKREMVDRNRCKNKNQVMNCHALR